MDISELDGEVLMDISSSLAAVSDDPEFTDVIENITVPAGRSVKLACSVKNLGNYKVSELSCTTT